MLVSQNVLIYNGFTHIILTLHFFTSFKNEIGRVPWKFYDITPWYYSITYKRNKPFMSNVQVWNEQICLNDEATVFGMSLNKYKHYTVIRVWQYATLTACIKPFATNIRRRCDAYRLIGCESSVSLQFALCTV